MPEVRSVASKLAAAAPLVLLAASVLLTAVLAWQAFASAASHRVLAERVLHDYAELAATEFSRRTTAFIGNYGVLIATRSLTEAARNSGDALPSREALRSVMPLQSRRAAEFVGSMFRFDTRRSTFVTEHRDVPQQIRDALLVRSRRPADAGFHAVHTALEGDTRLYVIAPTSDDAPPTSWVGFEVSMDAVLAWLAEFVARQPLLPEALASHEAARSALAIAVRSPDGRAIFRMPDRDSALRPIAIRDLAGAPAVTGLNGFSVEVALEPQAAQALIIGGLPSSQLGFVLALMALSGALAFAAGVQIRRERRHAEMRRDFVTRASHELRTPVARIRMFTETLLLDRVRSDAERRQTLRALDRGARRLSMLIDNVLQLSSRSSAVLQREPVDAAALLAEVVRDFQASVDTQGRIAVSGPPQLQAMIDVGAFRRVLTNLLDNAWKYGGSPPQVGVELALLGGELSVAVEDNGPGVPEPDRVKIWQPYVRLDRDRRSSVAGTGIGLAVVADLVERHGGTCRAEAGEKGARFVVTLPIAADTPGSQRA